MTRLSSALFHLSTTATTTTTTTTQSTAKRKALDMETSMNPLLAAAAAKRAKKDKSSNANKRKLLHNEDVPGGLLIVRAASTEQDTFSQQSTTTSRAASSQPQSQPQSQPPSKKFRAGSQPPPSRAPPRSKPPLSRKPSSSSRLLEEDEASHSDADLERDVRAMEDEADRLRRNSRAYALINQSILPSQGADNSMFQFPLPKASGNDGGRGALRQGKARGVSLVDMDTRIPITESETPQQVRNKRLREGAMAAIVTEREEGQEQEERGRLRGSSLGSKPGHHRRVSSSSRGKRISSSFETTGVITQPHNSVSEASFYKHIDPDLPDVERIRQLLIWCSLRAASTYQTASTPPTQTPLPVLSAKAAEVLKKTQDEFVRALAEKRIDLNVHASPLPSKSTTQDEDFRENEQNVRNRQWEVIYSSHIQRAQAEDEAWKKVSYEYDSYAKKLQASIEKRKKALEQAKAHDLAPLTRSKGKGKAEADVDMDEDEPPSDDDETWLSMYPQPHDLPPEFQEGAALARTVLLRNRHRHRTRRRGAELPLSPDADLEATLCAKLPSLQFKVDLLHTHLNAARATTSICERILDERFRILNQHLDARMRSASVPPPEKDAAADRSAAHVLTTYLGRSPSAHAARKLYPSSMPIAGPSSTRAQSMPPPPPSLPSTHYMPSPHTLLRTLTHIDAARPPAQRGDTARRAAREVQRVEESGIGVIGGERRVTLLPGMTSGLGVPATPRKGALGPPGTPGRRTPGRERTPGR